MTDFRLCRFFLAGLCAVALACVPPGVQASDSGSSDDWEYTASIYLWSSGIHVETASGGEFDIDFDDLLRNLDMAFMGSFEVRKEKFSLLADVVYMNLEVDAAASVPVPVTSFATVNVNVDGDVENKTWLLNLVGGYNVWKTRQGILDVLAGARYLDLDFDVDLGANAGRVSASRDLSPSDTVLDGVIGVKGHLNIDKQWFIPYYADIGTGQSDFTWQALTGVAYRFGWGDVSLTYRHIEWNFDDSPFDNAYLGGPMLAANFQF